MLCHNVTQLKKDKDKFQKQSACHNVIIWKLKVKQTELEMKSKEGEAQLKEIVKESLSLSKMIRQAQNQIDAQQELLKNLCAKLHATATAKARLDASMEWRIDATVSELMHAKLMEHGKWTEAM